MKELERVQEGSSEGMNQLVGKVGEEGIPDQRGSHDDQCEFGLHSRSCEGPFLLLFSHEKKIKGIGKDVWFLLSLLSAF